MLIYACLCHVNQFRSVYGDLFCRANSIQSFSSTCTPLITVFTVSGIVTENMRRWVANQFVKSWNVLEMKDQNYDPTCVFHFARLKH